MCSWGPTALLPVFHLLGTGYKHRRVFSKIIDEKLRFDAFTKVGFEYEDAVASIKVAKGGEVRGRTRNHRHGRICLRARPLVKNRLLRGPLRGLPAEQMLLLPA